LIQTETRHKVMIMMNLPLRMMQLLPNLTQRTTMMKTKINTTAILLRNQENLINPPTLKREDQEDQEKLGIDRDP